MSRHAYWIVAAVAVFGVACDDSASSPGTADMLVGEMDQGTGGSGGSGGITGRNDMDVDPDAGEEADFPERDVPVFDLGPDGPLPDAALLPDQGPDFAAPEERNGGIGEPCPRGYEQDCDPELTEACVFLGENPILPGVSAVCSRGCDGDDPCGAGLCCYPDNEGDRCLPAGFCALLREMGDACEENADCPAEAPLCATESGSGAKFCTVGCAGGGECPEEWCCDANAGGDPAGAICKPTDLCPEACQGDEDCPEVQRCVGGACVPRMFACQDDVDCPIAHRCDEGQCVALGIAGIGQDCSEADVACGEAAPLCVEFPEDRGQLCTYNCTFHRDCPATFCCADITGEGPDDRFCTDIADLCPAALPCDEDADCGADEFCSFGQCQPRGEQAGEAGDACEGPGDCMPELDCVFALSGRRAARGNREDFPNAGPGICSPRCAADGECGDEQCCRLAVQLDSEIGAGFCVTGNICEPGQGGGEGGGQECSHPSHCNPALFDRCVPNAFFGRVCSRACEADADCPGDMRCDARSGVCQPIPRCQEDADCGAGNRCAEGLCRFGERQCDVSADCEDPVLQRCFLGRCEQRARACADDEECDADEVCFAGLCEIAERPCAVDGDCRGGEACVAGFCGTPVLGFGEACADAELACGPGASQCLVDVDRLPGGMCTHACEFGSDCPGDSCCWDAEGANDPAFFVCAPGAFCEAAVVPEHRGCEADEQCLPEDFCHGVAAGAARCYDRGDGAATVGEACAGPGDCDLDQTVACVMSLVDGGWALGAVDEVAAEGPGTCQPGCVDDGDCVSGCCRHAVENGAPVAVCVDAGMCPDAGGPGEFCIPGAHDMCDPATTDACVVVDGGEDSYCARTCMDDVDCGGGCCRDVEGTSYCLQAAQCN